MNQTPDEIMEAAKQKAALKPNEQISVKLNETEYFAVTYSNERDTFDCSRMVVNCDDSQKQYEELTQLASELGGVINAIEASN